MQGSEEAGDRDDQSGVHWGPWFCFFAFFIASASMLANLTDETRNSPVIRHLAPILPSAGRNQNDHLGGEYLRIARAIVRGDGFSDPFGNHSGPTAWMPPALPFLQAGMLRLVGPEFLPVVVVGCKNLVLLLTVFTVFQLLTKSGYARYIPLASAMLLVTFLVDYYWYFQFTHDSWLVLLVMDLLLLTGTSDLSSDPSVKRLVFWGTLGGVSALCSPIVFMVWVLQSAYLGWVRRRLRVVAVPISLAVLFCMPWIVRNYLVFERVIPVKSNGFYELYQSMETGNGVLRMKDNPEHPFVSKDARDLYKKVGETKFLEIFKARALARLTDEPEEFVNRLKNRVIAALVWFQPYNSQHETGLWLVLKRIIHPLVVAGLVLMMVGWSRSPNTLQTFVVLTFLSYLLPYILVSFYWRYMLPLTAVNVCVVVWGLANVRAMAVRWALALKSTEPTTRRSIVVRMLRLRE